MAKMIYRGVEHSGVTQQKSVKARSLIYRGVAHDGIVPVAPTPLRTIGMTYRGVKHVISVGSAEVEKKAMTRTAPTPEMYEAPAREKRYATA